MEFPPIDNTEYMLLLHDLPSLPYAPQGRLSCQRLGRDVEMKYGSLLDPPQSFDFVNR